MTFVVPKDQPLWAWLFESNLSKIHSDQLQGFTDVATKQYISYQNLKKYTENLSTVLTTEYNLHDGDVIIIFNKNSIWYPVIALAAVRIGAIACGISPEYTVDELKYALQLTKAKAIFTSGNLLEKATKATAASGLSRKNLIVIGNAKGG